MPKLFSNTSSLVVSQLPDYIRGDYVSYVSNNDIAEADYSKFLQFVEAYYRFLEIETYPTEVLQNAREYADVEKTLDNANVSLVESFFKNYGYDIPRNLVTNKKHFVKFFKDIYKTKGTEEAAKLLFRVLYNTNTEFLYPGDYILKASDGQWIQDKSILVAPLGGGVPTYRAQIFKKTNDTPTAPIGGKFDFDSEILEPPTGWTITEPPIDKVPTWSTDVIFYSSGTLSTNTWEPPYIISKKPSSGTIFYTPTIYIQQPNIPSAPTGGFYNFRKGILELPTGWSITRPKKSSTPVWYTSFYFNTTDPRATVYATTWNTPQLATQSGPTNVFSFLNTKIIGSDSKATAKVKDVLKIIIQNRSFGFDSLVENTTEFYELFLEDIIGNFKKETIFSENNSNFLAKTYYRLNKIDIIDGAAGYNLSSPITHDSSILKVTKVSETGEIKHVSIIDSGVYFPQKNITNSYVSSFITVGVGLPEKVISSNVVIDGRIATISSIQDHGVHIGDQITLSFYGNSSSSLNLTNLNATISKIIDDKRAVVYLSSSYYTNLKSNITYNTYANLKANLSILKEYDGRHLNGKGRLSDNYFIQGALPDAPDSSILYYQPFSYKIKSEQPISKWKNIVKNTIHPSGLEVFGDLLLIKDNFININTTGKSEIQDYFGLTADYFNDEVKADSTYYTYPKTGTNFPINADHVILIFGFL